MAQLTYNRRKAKRAALAAIGATEKRPTAGQNVSHAQNKTKRLFKPNIQKTKVLVDGKLVSVRLDARTIRSLTKTQKLRPVKAAQPKRAAAKTTAQAAAKKPAAKKTPAKKTA
jgi:large subunit ribosomal protein L28